MRVETAVGKSVVLVDLKLNCLYFMVRVNEFRLARTLVVNSVELRARLVLVGMRT